MRRHAPTDRPAGERAANREGRVARKRHATVVARPWDPGTRRWDDEVRCLAVDDAAGPRRVSMACLGRTGQWGNALMAYFYLLVFADVQAMIPEVPRWIGQDFFGFQDAPLTYAHPFVLYDGVSTIGQDRYHPMVTASLATSRARALGERGRHVMVLRDPLLARREPSLPPTCDLEGPYLVHTRHLARHRDRLQRAVEPVPAVRDPLDAAWRALRRRGETVIGVHVRRGDFESKFVHQGFEFITPIEWYRRWLDDVWREAERPVLFLATDSPDRVLPAFARYRPVTIADLMPDPSARSSVLDLPPAHLERTGRFFPDWYLLTRCDALAVSNSTFSFTASMVNDRASRFMRPDPQVRALVPFDPWDSEPLLFLPTSGNLLREVMRRFAAAQRGVGLAATLPNLSRAVHWYAQVLRLRAIAARHYGGRAGLLREVLRPQFYLAARRQYDGGEVGRAEAALLTSVP